MNHQNLSGVVFRGRLPIPAKLLCQMVEEFIYKLPLINLEPDEYDWHGFSAVWVESVREISIVANSNIQGLLSGYSNNPIDIYYEIGGLVNIIYETGGKDSVLAEISYSYNQLDLANALKNDLLNKLFLDKSEDLQGVENDNVKNCGEDERTEQKAVPKKIQGIRPWRKRRIKLFQEIRESYPDYSYSRIARKATRVAQKEAKEELRATHPAWKERKIEAEARKVVSDKYGSSEFTRDQVIYDFRN